MITSGTSIIHPSSKKFNFDLILTVDLTVALLTELKLLHALAPAGDAAAAPAEAAAEGKF